MTDDQEAELDEQTDAGESEEELEDEPETTEADAEETEEAETEEETDEADDADEEDGLQEGDFVEIDYTAYTVEEERLVDTTDPDVAAEEGVDDGDREFEPRTIVLGEGHIFGAVEDAVIGGEVGDTGTVTISAEDAFGEYDPDNVETVSAEKIDEDDRYPGAHVHLDGRHGYISTIIGGRARVDFNHPLAGEDVEYEYEILDVVDDREQRAAGLIEMYLDVKLDLWIETDEVEEEVLVESDEDSEEDEESEPEYETQTVEKETLYIEATPQLSMNQQWMFSKQQIAQDIMGKVGVDRVIVQEVIDGMGGMGMPGMMGGMGGGVGGDDDVEDALEDADVDVDDIMEELQAEHSE